MFNVEHSDGRFVGGDVTGGRILVGVVPVHNNIERRIGSKFRAKPGKNAECIVDIAGRYPSRHGNFCAVGLVQMKFALRGVNMDAGSVFVRKDRIGEKAVKAPCVR